MPRPARRPWVAQPPARLCPARRALASARLPPDWPLQEWRLCRRLWKNSSLWFCWGSTVLWLRLVRALAQPRRRTKLLPRLRPQPPRGRPAPAPSPGAAPGAFPVRAPPLAPSRRCLGAFVWPGQNGDSAVPPARAEKPPLEQLYREGPLLGSGGGGGGVYSGTRLADGVPHKGALVPLELALLWMVSWPGFRGVVRLLDWFEMPEGFALVMERPERCQELWYFLHERRFQTEPVARRCSARGWKRGGTHCSSRRVLHRHIKAENVLVHLATGEAKLIDFGCGTMLEDTFYTRMPGMPEYSPPEWILFGCYQGQPATIWSLRILLYELVCGHLPFHTSEDIICDQLFFPPQNASTSSGGVYPWIPQTDHP
ncbi:serine/threonine-protein kinase pim-3 isoform X2 [Zonotrichia albicollis]|uniref:serine/threonine-protein kinase pim-3 isoform X2 n=1 Tax=Zonotrichia albicollis TaxID=44394 RepID=UPI003D80CA76